MDAKQMYIEWQRRLQLADPTLALDEKPTSDTAFSFLNAAQDRKVKYCFDANDQMIPGTRVHKHNMDDIKSLLVEQEILPAGTTLQGFNRFRTPTDATREYYLYVKSVVKATGTYKQLTGTVKLPTVLTNYESLDAYETTAFNKPIIREPAIAFYSDPTTKLNYIVVAADSYTDVNSLILTYYRKPLRFNTISGTNTVSTCELPEHLHSEIIDIAVEMFITEAKYRLAIKQPTQDDQN